jgi:hypothetical protein
MPIYQAIYDGPPRWYGNTRTSKTYIAIHSTENSASAEAEADYAQRRDDSTSSHYYVDANSIVQSLDTDLRAFHAGSRSGNDKAIAYELTGRAAWSRSQWLGAVAWPLLATQIRLDCAAHNIVPRDLSVAQIQAGSLTGIITHNEMRLAWGGTDHTDPGPNFPMDHLIGLLQEDDMALTTEDLDRIYATIWRRDGIPAPDVPSASTNPTWQAASYLSSIRNGAWRAVAQVEELAAGQAAILAAVAGEDVAAAVRAELDTHRAALLVELGQVLVPAVLAGLREQLGEVADERLVAAAEAGVRAALGGLDQV